MKKVLLFIFFFSSVFLHAQIIERTLYNEKVYLSTDKDIYRSSDTIRVKGFVVDSWEHKMDSVSKYLYFELADINDNILIRRKIRKDKYGFNTSFVIPDTMLTGSYFLRGYTQPMKFLEPEYIFTKRILLNNEINVDDVATDYKGEILSTEKEYEMNFFPEGGNLIADVPQRVVFLCRDQYGLPVKTKGYIINNLNDTISEVSTKYNGYGDFAIITAKDIEYSFVADGGKQFKVPDVSDKPNIRVVYHGGKFRFKADALNSDALLTIHSHGGVLQSLKITPERSSGVVDDVNLHEGLLCFSLSDTSGVVLSERVCYVRKQIDEERFSIETENGVIRLFSDSLLKGDFILSVTRKNDINNVLLRSGIRPNILLQSELSFPVINLNGTFVSDEFVDLILVTVKWNRFIHNAAAIEYDFSRENNESVYGKIKGQRMKNATIYGGVLDNIYSVDLDENGNFFLELPDFPSECDFFIQPTLKNSKAGISTIEVASDFFPEIKNNYKVLSALDLKLSSDAKKKDNYVLTPISYTDKSGLRTLKINDVVVTGKRKSETSERKEFYAAVKLVGNDVAKYSSFGISGAVDKLMNVKVTVSSDGTLAIINERSFRGLFNSCPMSVLVDGVFTDVSQALMMDASEVKSIERVSVGESSIYGTRGFCGIIKIETYGAGDIPNKTVESKGISFSKTGYYPETLNTFNDKFMSVGKIDDMTIKAPKERGVYIIKIEGVTTNGEIVEYETEKMF